MPQLTTIVAALDSLLETQRFNDTALNGLQIEAGCSEVRRVAFAVDSGLSVIQIAIAREANLLIVHHGLFWGSAQPLVGALGKKIELLHRSRLALYASHLPLDAHLEVGNAAGLARFFELENIKAEFEYSGTAIGVVGNCREARKLDYFIEKAQALGPTPILSLPHGKSKINKVALVTGSGAFGIDRAARLGCDLFISGEPKQQVFHETKELNLNALFCGHYATETFGVRALSQKLARDFEVQVDFIDEPTGI